MDRAHAVAVIGAGFSGVLTAVHLLRAPGRLRVVLVNRTGRMARGVAYGTRSPAHLLNVPAGKMSAFPDDPDHFLRYAQTHDPAATAGTFLPRSVYGAYLEAVLEEAERATAGRLDRVVGEVMTIEPGSGPARLTTSNGGVFFADRVALALGNYPPRDPDLPDRSALESPRYILDPWAPDALTIAEPDQWALLVGTGLTMMDVALDLHARGHRGPVLAVSRHGLLPQGHAPGPPPDPAHGPPGLLDGPATVRAYVRAVRTRVDELAAQGIAWRTVIDSLRPITAALWQRLPAAERERFLRHVKAYWEVVRHRAAAGPAGSLRELIEAGWLRVRAARVMELRSTADGFDAVVRERGTWRMDELRVGTVINCTGPSGDVRTSRDPLMAYLRDRGMISPDPLGLGIAVAPDGAVVDQSGKASDLLYYIGPMARAGYWERTAVPELRVAARDLAGTIAASMGLPTAAVWAA